MFRSRVKLYNDHSPQGRTNLVLSTLTKGGHPVSITNYAPEEKIVVDVPMTIIQQDCKGHAAIGENGLDTIIHVAGQAIAILKDYVGLDKIDLRFVAKSYAEDRALYERPTIDAADDAAVIEASDRLIVVKRFDLNTDKLEIGEGRVFQLEDAHDCSGTVVVVDGEPTFLLPGILPAQMACALVQADGTN